jgi:hypothetical protein
MSLAKRIIKKGRRQSNSLANFESNQRKQAEHRRDDVKPKIGRRD